MFNVSSTVFSDKYDLNVTLIKNVLTVFFRVNEDVAIPVLWAEIFFQSLDTGQYNLEVMNRTINMCIFVRNKLYEPLIQIGYRIMQEHGDVPLSCPLKKVRELYRKFVSFQIIFL